MTTFIPRLTKVLKAYAIQDFRKDILNLDIFKNHDFEKAHFALYYFLKLTLLKTPFIPNYSSTQIDVYHTY